MSAPLTAFDNPTDQVMDSIARHILPAHADRRWLLSVWDRTDATPERIDSLRRLAGKARELAVSLEAIAAAEDPHAILCAEASGANNVVSLRNI